MPDAALLEAARRRPVGRARRRARPSDASEGVTAPRSRSAIAADEEVTAPGTRRAAADAEVTVPRARPGAGSTGLDVLDLPEPSAHGAPTARPRRRGVWGVLRSLFLPAPDELSARVAIALFCLGVGGVAVARSALTPQVADGLLVEVSGEVPAPGWYVVDPPTLAAAVEAAGGPSVGLVETPLSPGDAVWVGPASVEVVAVGQPLLVGVPLDPNVAAPRALMALPGISEGLAARIVEHRETWGPFGSSSALAAVSGVSQRHAAELAPYLSLPAVPPKRPPLDLNRATAAQLERLPGIGPALAARIIADREQRGPFGSVAALARVKGIGPATVKRMEGKVVAVPR